jgi:hypothetical protein
VRAQALSGGIVYLYRATRPAVGIRVEGKETTPR